MKGFRENLFVPCYAASANREYLQKVLQSVPKGEALWTLGCAKKHSHSAFTFSEITISQKNKYSL